MFTRRLLLSSALLLTGMTLPAAGQELTASTYDGLRATIDVKPSELRWQEVNWLSMWDGLLASQRQDRPIFYWIYFGDPRGGC